MCFLGYETLNSVTERISKHMMVWACDSSVTKVEDIEALPALSRLASDLVRC